MSNQKEEWELEGFSSKEAYEKHLTEWVQRANESAPAFIEGIQKAIDDGVIKFDKNGNVIPPNDDNDPLGD